MNRLFVVIRREYIERVRSKAFIIGTILGPLLMFIMTLGPSLLMAKAKPKPLRVVVVDASGEHQTAVEEALCSRRSDNTARFDARPRPEGSLDEVRAHLKAQVLAGRLDGYLFLPQDVLENGTIEYAARNVANFQDIYALSDVVSGVLTTRRLRDEGLDPGRVKRLTRRVNLKTLQLTETGMREERGPTTFMFALFLMMLIYISVIMWGQALLNGVIEEKTNRVVEVVASSVSPQTLLAGKVLGIGSAGLTQLAVWLMCVLGAVAYASTGVVSLPLPEITPLIAASFVVFFVLGYFLFSLLYGAIGAAVNSHQEAQSLVFLVITPLVAPFVFFPIVMRSPDGLVSVVISLIPFFTPLIMFLRIVIQTPPLWQIGLSIILTALTIVGLTLAVARVYRVGILMYGKRPTLPEILHWIRVS